MKRTIVSSPRFRLTDNEKYALKQLDLGRFVEENCNIPCRTRSQGISYYPSPFRQEKEPSFTVQYFKGEWHWRDWGGDEEDRGDIFSLVMRLWNVSFLEAAQMLMAREFPADYYRREKESQTMDKQIKLELVKKIYARMLKLNDLTLITQYFQGKGVTYHYPMACAIRNDFKEGKVYVAIPIPTPWNMRGLEMRELKGNSRKTLGEKTLWYLNRDTKRVLITESVLDCLAGEIILGDSGISLCSINGVGNVQQIKDYIKHFKPEEVFLAFDNDGPGITARDKAIEIASEVSTGIVLVEDHINAGVKDLHRLLATERKSKQAQGDIP